MDTKKKIYLIAGEASGDLHGANLIRHLRARSKTPLEIYGVGGDKIRETGAREFLDIARFHVTGVTDALRAFPKYKKAEKDILSGIRRARPDLVVLIDNPGFNLHLAGKIHALGIPIAYFIAPQVWAWAPKRVEIIKKYVKKVLVVFRFEKDFFEKHGVAATWVGHPLKDIVEESAFEPNLRPGRPGRVVSLLPGSRKGELKVLLPILLKAAARIRSVLPGTAFTLIKAATLPQRVYDDKLRKLDFPVQVVEKYAYDTVRESELALVCSGTATLECALLGTPMVIVYKGGLVTYVAAKRLIKVPCLGLPNLILGEKKFPELLQFDATAEKIAEVAVDILSDKQIYQEMKEACAETSRRIGETGASVRAADEILSLL